MSDKDANRDYLSVNRELWNARVPHHIASSFYDVPGFLEGKSSLNAIELELLGDVKGKTVFLWRAWAHTSRVSICRMLRLRKRDRWRNVQERMCALSNRMCTHCRRC